MHSLPSTPPPPRRLLQTECVQAPHHCIFDIIYVPLCDSGQAGTVLNRRDLESPTDSVPFRGYFTDCQLVPLNVLSSGDTEKMEKQLLSLGAQPIVKQSYKMADCTYSCLPFSFSPKTPLDSQEGGFP